METTTLKAEPRSELGTHAARRLRTTGYMPVVIYGHGAPPESVSLLQHDVEVALTHGVRMLYLGEGAKAKPFLIKEVQYDHLGHSPIHMDLARVDLDERVTVHVAIELRGVPKGVSEGGLLEQLMPEVEIECRVTEIPDTLRPVVTDLQLGDALFVKDLELPEGVQVLVDGEERVAMVRHLATAAEPEAEAEGEEEPTEEPERIGRTRKDEGESEETKSSK